MTVSKLPAIVYVLGITAAAWLILDVATVLTVIVGLLVAAGALAALGVVIAQALDHGRAAAIGGAGALVLFAGLAAWFTLANSTVGIYVVLVSAVAAGIMVATLEPVGATLARLDEEDRREREADADAEVLRGMGIEANPYDGPNETRRYR